MGRDAERSLGSLDAVEDALTQGLSRQPEEPTLRLALGVLKLIQFNKDQPEKAREAHHLFTALRDEYPAWPGPIVGLAEISLHAGDWTQFDRLIGEAMPRLDPARDHELCDWVMRLLPFVPSGPERAKAMLRSLIEAHPEDASYRILYGVLYQSESPDEAEAEFEAARRLVGEEDFDAMTTGTREVISRWGPQSENDSRGF